jgi:hypothetical protein
VVIEPDSSFAVAVAGQAKRPNFLIIVDILTLDRMTVRLKHLTWMY